jgi:hypothetical protein
MPHSYKWADAEHTVVQRDDGRSFVWPKGANVANINGRVAEDYRREGSPKPAPYKTPEPVAAARPKQQATPPATVVSAEAVLSDLDAQRRNLAAARAADDAARSKVAYQAHALHELEASRSLREINGRAIEHEAKLREIDCAIAEAGDRLAAAKAAVAMAANRQKAAEAIALVKELGECFPYLDRKLAEAANALVAINDGVQKLHQAGFTFPSDAQVRLAVAAIIQSWAHRLPKHFHDQLRDGLEFLEPGRRQTAGEYWAKIQASIGNQITQRLGEQPKQDERAA